MGKLTVACLTYGSRVRYKEIAEAMAKGIAACGDVAIMTPGIQPIKADVAVMYGWKMHHWFKVYPKFVYADLGYWERGTHYRFSVNGWSPEKYVHQGLSPDRLNALCIEAKPWRSTGDEIIVMGASQKSMEQHGFKYMQWETAAVRKLQGLGKRVVYRPKPNDPQKRPIPGILYDERPLAEALASAWAVATHHSNAAIDALVAGVPVHCVTGAAAAFSVPLESLGDPPLLSQRRRFLQDVAWLQWSVHEMKIGHAWKHLRKML